MVAGIPILIVYSRGGLILPGAQPRPSRPPSRGLRPIIDRPYLGSTGNWAANQAFQPPLSANTFLKPRSVSCRATLALVCSLGQAQ